MKINMKLRETIGKGILNPCKKVAITGSAGFIGSNLVEACINKGWEVIGIDDFSTGHRPMADPKRYERFGGKYSFYEDDILNTERLTELFKDVDVVFHLAALARVAFSIDFPMQANEANVTGTLSVLEAARKANVRRVVFSGSSSIFGGVAEFPTPETARPVPKSPYALHKLAGIEYCRLYSELHGLDTVSLLYFNVYGPHQRTGGAYSTIIPAFMEAAVNGESCRIDGETGLQSRDFTYVSDVIQANILAATSEKIFEGEKFNIACGETHSVNEIYNEINKLFDGNVKKHHAPSRLGDPMKSHADISKAKRVLGYEPQVSFAEGIAKTADWWKEGCLV